MNLFVSFSDMTKAQNLGQNVKTPTIREEVVGPRQQQRKHQQKKKKGKH
jgi:hypothetical protein